MAPPPLDTIDLLINGKEVLSAKEYDVSIGYFTTPSSFSMTLGSGGTVLDLMRTCPPNSIFALRVNGIVQFMGYTDGFEDVGSEAAEITVSGRDIMAQLIRDHIEHDRSFNNATFEQLAEEAIKGSGITEFTLFLDAVAQLSAVVGTPITDTVTQKKTFTSGPIIGQKFAPEVGIVSTGQAAGTPFAADVVSVRSGTTVVSTEQQKKIQVIKGYKAEKPIKWDAGETWLAAVKKDFDRAGIFLRAGVDPDGNDPNIFQLTAPDGNQPAKFWLLNTRREGTPENAVLVGRPKVRYVMTGRHSEYVVHGVAGGGKDGRKAVEGRYIDAEVQSAGIFGKLVKKDPQAKNTRQANFIARKMRAEECRANRSFVYPIPHRHTVPLIENPATRIVPAPGLVGHVRDDERGINGPMWVERVRHHSSVQGGTFTELTLIDPQDLVFGEDEPGQAVPPRATAKHHRRST